MERYEVNRGRFIDVYVKTGNTEGLIEYLEKVELTEGYLLWEIGASYARSLPPTRYYVAARSAREAKQIFKASFSWLDCISFVGLPDADTTEYILNNPKKVAVI